MLTTLPDTVQIQCKNEKRLCTTMLTPYASLYNLFARLALPSLCIILLGSITTATASPSSRHISADTWSQAMHNVITRYAPNVERRFARLLRQHNISSKPQDLALLAFKEEQKVELWAKHKNHWRYLKSYPIKGKSGGLGPKLREGDRQIPEGIYSINAFNPMSQFHLSMRLNYPNQFDRQKGRTDHRRKLGNNIFIHGKNVSAGCLAIGDKAIEELFVIMRRFGKQRTRVIIAPYDMRSAIKRRSSHPRPLQKPRWLPELYSNINRALNTFS